MHSVTTVRVRCVLGTFRRASRSLLQRAAIRFVLRQRPADGLKIQIKLYYRQQIKL
nr:MAG TPA_asm: hypothetical protein [Caudoviricetes sp.]